MKKTVALFKKYISELLAHLSKKEMDITYRILKLIKCILNLHSILCIHSITIIGEF